MGSGVTEMVHEYRKLSQTFEEIKAENGCLKNSLVESSTAQLEDTDILQIELSFSVGESSSGETSTQSDQAYDKFKKMNFVKASVIHDACESVKYDDQISPKLNHKIAVDNRQSGPRPEPRLLHQAALEALTRSARTDSPRRTGRKQISGDDRRRRRRRRRELREEGGG
ncbi:hypothetical protein F511_32821 [Dorcoceras hygrometricum]|uniref:Uncharacterized protein n=1 Tax=Dorcoceras hygrometricum TaxID=472368 RepID=A0A2Z7AMS9_9LAMI|nr:hypothetical protein F511_32821 [Dorcoceras hygrometricum]